MKAYRSFTVRTQLPANLAPLQELATNLRWSWNDRARQLFRWVEPELWEQVGRDPVRLLSMVGSKRLQELSDDPSFMAFLDEMHDDLTRYLDAPGWLQHKGSTPLTAIAYLSAEFGISEALPQYSGGLGVLAGDHLKAASALNIPLTGIGLFYRQGYFRQAFDQSGYQLENYPVIDPHLIALTPAPAAGSTEQARVTVDLGDRPLHARVWRAQVGRISLYLLDTDIEENPDDLRMVTDRLYGGGEEHRITQEILLGMGGLRALRTLGIPTQVFHMNEGHAGFLGLERIRELLRTEGLRWDEAIEAVRAGTLFTTHTPVPAGIDRFPRALMEKYFRKYTDECSISFDEFMELGHEPGMAAGEKFNMAVMGLRLAGQANGVAKLHGAVSRKMFSPMWPGVPENEVPIAAVTNGVHGRTWVSQQMGELLERYVLPEWPEAAPDRWARIHDCPDDVLWRVKQEGRSRLVSYARERLRVQLAQRGLNGADSGWSDRALDPSILTIGFSRRFATYKRSTLLLSDPDRLKRLLLDKDRPLQIIFAGKAHPADQPGKELIKRIQQFASSPETRHRICFIEDYDIGVARMLYQGSDVWLNTPIRPMEACGTSGMKAALNGALQLSVLDGWWDEMYRPASADRPANGWAIPSAEAMTGDGRDWAEAQALFELLERDVVPLFYDRPDGALPRRWIYRVKTGLQTLGGAVLASRMVKDYTTNHYEPAAARTTTMTPALARELAAWKTTVRQNWSDVKILEVSNEESSISELGSAHMVSARVELGRLRAEDVSVQLLHGSVGLNDEIDNPVVVPMQMGPEQTYNSSFVAEKAGRHGYTVRVVPHHVALPVWTEVPSVTWA